MRKGNLRLLLGTLVPTELLILLKHSCGVFLLF